MAASIGTSPARTSSTPRPSSGSSARRRPSLGSGRRTRSSATSKPRAQRIVDAYFSRDHFDDRESCCPLIALSSDVARGSGAVKAAYREVLEKLIGLFQADLDEPRTRERALALVALCVGGMVVARCVDDPALADDLRRAAHRHALKQAGGAPAASAVERFGKDHASACWLLTLSAAPLPQAPAACAARSHRPEWIAGAIRARRRRVAPSRVRAAPMSRSAAPPRPRPCG